MSDSSAAGESLIQRVETLKQEVAASRGQLERQRRRVDALLFEHQDATAAKTCLDLMERGHVLKEIYLDQLIGQAKLAGELRLHRYDIHQMAQRFGCGPEALTGVVARVGPDLDLVMAELGKAV